MTLFDKALKQLPDCITGLDLVGQHRTISDLIFAVQTQMDFYYEGETTDIQTTKDLIACQRFVGVWKQVEEQVRYACSCTRCGWQGYRTLVGMNKPCPKCRAKVYPNNSTVSKLERFSLFCEPLTPGMTVRLVSTSTITAIQEVQTKTLIRQKFNHLS